MLRAGGLSLVNDIDHLLGELGECPVRVLGSLDRAIPGLGPLVKASGGRIRVRALGGTERLDALFDARGLPPLPARLRTALMRAIGDEETAFALIDEWLPEHGVDSERRNIMRRVTPPIDRSTKGQSRDLRSIAGAGDLPR